MSAMNILQTMTSLYHRYNWLN